MAPEILLKRNYDVLVDSFSAGIVLFILCSGGMHPFYSGKKSRKEYINQLISQKGLCKFSLQMPLLARNLFLKLCKFEAMNRYEPYKALNHPWITRCTKSQIPMTLLEEYSKSEKIKIFRGLLSTPLALIILKKYLLKNSKIENKSMKIIYKNPSNTINNTHQLLNLKDKYFLFSDIKKKSKILFSDNPANNEEEKTNKERKNGRNKLASINIGHNIKIARNPYKIQDSSIKNNFIKTGLNYHNNKNVNTNNYNQNCTELKSTVRTHSSKDNINLKESLRPSRMRKSQKKSAAHILINNIKINKEKEKDKSNININRHKVFLSEKKNNENYLNSNTMSYKYNNINNNNSNNKLLLSSKHIIIESKNRNKNDSSDVKKNNENTKFETILEKNKYNFNSKINLQLKFRDSSNKINTLRHKERNNLIREVFNNDDF